MRKTFLSMFLLSILVFSMFGCENSAKNNYDYKPITQINLSDNTVSSHISNSNAEYVYTVSVFDTTMTPITVSNPLLLTTTTNINIQLQCNSLFDIQFGIIVLSSCIPIQFSVNQDSNLYFCYPVSCSDSNIQTLQLSFSPSLITDNESLHIIIIENTDAPSSSLPIEKDFSYAIEVPILISTTNYVHSNSFYLNGNKWVDNIYETLQYSSLTSEEQSIVDTNITSVKNNSLNITLSMDNSPSLNSKNTLVSSIGEICSGWIKGYGQAGKYASIIFVDNIPVEAFEGNYCLIWEAADYNKFLNAPFSIKDLKAGVHTIYVLTISLDNANKPIVYDSYKLGLLLTDTSNNGRIYEDISVQFMDSLGNILEPKDNILSGNSNTIYLEFSHSLFDAYMPRKYTLYILCNGLIQDITVNDIISSSTVYTLTPQETYTTKIYFTPTLPYEPDSESSLINLDILFLPELDNIQNSDLDNTVSFHKRFFLDSSMISYSANNTVSQLSSLKSDVSAETPTISLSTPDAAKIEYLFMGRYMKNNSVTIHYAASGLPKGSYVVFALLNGQLLELDSEFLSYEIDSPSQKVELTYTLTNDTIQKIKIVFITISLEQPITQRSHIYYNQLMFEQINCVPTDHGSIHFSRSFDDIYTNYVSFTGTLQATGYCYSYNYIHRKPSQTISPYGYSDHINSLPLTNEEVIIEYFESPTAWIVENITHIYFSQNNKFTVIKYRTPAYS